MVLTPADCVQGIIIRPLGTEKPFDNSTLKLDEHHFQLLVTQVPRSALADAEWQPSPLSAKLGRAVMIRPSQLADARNGDVFNHAAQLLMLEPDPEDDEFGSSICGQLYGDQLAVRADGQSMGGKSLRLLLRYVQEQLEEVRFFFRTEYEDRRAKARDIAAAKITVEALKAFG